MLRFKTLLIILGSEGKKLSARFACKLIAFASNCRRFMPCAHVFSFSFRELSNPCRQSTQDKDLPPSSSSHAHAHEISRINYSNLISFKYTHPLGCSTARHVCMFVPPFPALKNLKIFAAKFSRPHRVILRGLGGSAVLPAAL